MKIRKTSLNNTAYPHTWITAVISMRVVDVILAVNGDMGVVSGSDRVYFRGKIIPVTGHGGP
jgi:hypothetical protein